MAERQTRRRFTSEIKAEAVKRLLEGGKRLLEVATELGHLGSDPVSHHPRAVHGAHASALDVRGVASRRGQRRAWPMHFPLAKREVNWLPTSMVVRNTERLPDPDRAWLQAYNHLRGRIVSCELAPGTRLSESTVAKELGLSRTPVREAFIRLHVEGLVKVSPQRGSFVAPIDPAAAEDAQLLRVALESQAAQRAARACAEDSLAELRAVIDGQRRAGAAGDRGAFMALDDALHFAIFALAGLSRLWPIVHSAKAQLDRVRFLTLQNPQQLGTVLEEHAALVDAIGSGEELRAEAALKRHLDSSFRQIADRLASLAAPAAAQTSNHKEAAGAPPIRRKPSCSPPELPSPAAIC